jgi:hypothetical protein
VTEHPEALGLEQRCIRPGEWMIEGYRVERVGYRSWHKNCIDWLIFAVGDDSNPVHMTKTLARAREWIREQRN